MPEIEIKRGFEVLPDNNIRFCIRISNNTEFIIVDVKVILDYSGSIFKLDGNILQNLATINPKLNRNAEFILKPLGCIHKVKIGATIRYKDHTGKRYTIEMYPKEVHCVCPFLMGKQMAKSEFFELLNTGQSVEMGLDFRGVSFEQLTSFFDHTYKSRYYKVEDISINGGRILFYASDSIGEKAYYLLTALIKEEKETTG